VRLFVDPRYLEERARFSLRATCDHCAHFDTDHARCSLGYPTDPHREPLHQGLRDGDVLLFCKTFEAG
jgi:hypothetical protein